MISGKSRYKKTGIVATFSMFSFCQYGRQQPSRSSGSALITAGAPRRSSPPSYFSYPISVLIGGLLSENEAGQLALCPQGRLSKSENIVSDCQRIAAAIASAALHVLNRSFFIFKENHFFTHLADFFESFAVLMRAA
jgi:hypothetical protein